MTKKEWLESVDPTAMIHSLPKRRSLRKLRLFAIACARNVWEWLVDERSRTAVEIADMYTDGQVDDDRLRVACDEAERALSEVKGRVQEELPEGSPYFQATCCAYHTTEYPVCFALGGHSAAVAAAETAMDVDASGAINSPQQLADLLRDIFGNPFRRVKLNPNWLTSTVLALAQQMHDTRDFTAMPILADALQDAGCDNANILEHCRGPGTHARGCWVLDLILSKER